MAEEPATKSTERAGWLLTVAKAILWSGAVALSVLGVLMTLGVIDNSGTDAVGRGLSVAFGFLLAADGITSLFALFLARRWPLLFWLAAAMLGAPLLLASVLSFDSKKQQAEYRAETDDLRNGKADFADQPALLAVAEAISRNDEPALRVAAKAAPDLQASGREGKTLLYFAVERALEQPQLIRAVETLLSLGCDPNYNNGQRTSFALAHAVNGEIRLLRTMLDAGGDPNGRDPDGRPIIFGNWTTTFFEAERSARFRLLLDRGADIDSIIPPDANHSAAGYSLLLFRTKMGRGDQTAYADGRELLERGADPSGAAPDGMTLTKMLAEHRRSFVEEQGDLPAELGVLLDWLERHGIRE